MPDVVEDGVSGLLLDPDDVEGLAEAIMRVLSNRELAERMGQAARERAETFLFTPEQFAERMAELVEKAVTAR